MNELQIFKKDEFGEVRTIVEGNRVLFCGSDIAKALGYKNPSRDVQRHCKNIEERCTTDSVGRQQDMLFIPKGDIYRLAARSELPGADAFESWIFDEVIPGVLQDGGYIKTDANMSDQEIMARALVVAQKTIAHKDELLSSQAAQIEQDKPKVLFAEAVDVSDDCILIRQLASFMTQNGVNTGERRLFEWMRENGYLIRKIGADRNLPTQKSLDLKIMSVKERTRVDPDGTSHPCYTPYVTGKGQMYFLNKFLAKEKEPSVTLDGNRKVL